MAIAQGSEKENAKFSGQITSCLALPWLFLQERQTGEETERGERRTGGLGIRYGERESVSEQKSGSGP